MSDADARLRGPPAIWAAFAAQGRWKNWVLAAQLLVILVQAGLSVAVALKPPDIIVVEKETGDSTYVPAGLGTAALQDWLRQQRGRAADITVLSFARRFIRLTAAVNSSTIEEAWAESLGMMVAPLAKKVAEEAAKAKLLDSYRLAQVRTSLEFGDLRLVERRGDRAHVRATVARRREHLVGGGDGSASEDTLQVDLVLVDVARSAQHPDGLEVLDWHSAPLPASTALDGGVSDVTRPQP